MFGFSRDCLASAGDALPDMRIPPHCAACRNCDFVDRPIDFDAFYATVEKHDRPLLCDIR
jgi:hypothetical protein